VKASLGDWAGAVADAQQVPPGFVYNALYSTNSFRENNSLVQETYVRREFTVFGTMWAQVFNDPRVPWDTIYTNSNKTAIQKGQDGKTNFFRQRKYTDLGSDIPLVKGTEMLMLRAEKALRDGDIPTAFGFINQQRAVYGLSALAVPTDIKVAWATLEKERGAVTWLEGRRLWDLRRWFNEGTGSGARDAGRVVTPRSTRPAFLVKRSSRSKTSSDLFSLPSPSHATVRQANHCFDKAMDR
jgi:hypothetical protein